MQLPTILLVLLVVLLLLSSVLAAILLTILLRRISRRLPREPVMLARVVADEYVRRFNGIPTFPPRRVGTAFPLRDPIGQEDTLFDVKLLDADGKDGGYIIVNTDRRDLPVSEFSWDGPSLHEKFRDLLGQQKFHLRWFSPTYSVAFDDDGKTIAEIGDYLLPEESSGSPPQQKDTQAFLARVAKERERFRERHSRRVRSAWNRLAELRGGAGTSEYTRESVPPGEYSVWEAKGWWRDPLLRQIPPLTGANDKICKSGCGPVAWATLIGYHDLVFSPDLLRGSQNRNGQLWGTEEAWNCYLDRLQMELGRDNYLDVHGFYGDAGFTSDNNMKEGFDFIEEELGFTMSDQSHYGGGVTGHDEAAEVQKVFDAIYWDKRAIIVKTPGHFCVAGGFLRHPEINLIENQWLHINTGWGDRRYINCSHVEQHWYFKQVYPTVTKKTYSSLIGLNAPAVVNALGRWCVFWKGSEEGVVSVYGDSLFNLDESTVTMHHMPVIHTHFAPVVSGYEKYLYLLVVPNDGFVRLYWTADLKSWAQLPFPEWDEENRRVTSTVRPAILWSPGRITVAIYRPQAYGIEIISSTDPTRWWPTKPGEHSDRGYWTYCQVHTTGDLAMAQLGDQLYLVWANRDTNDNLWAYVGPVNPQGGCAPEESDDFYFGPVSGPAAERLYSSIGSLVTMSKSIYLASGAYGVTIDRLGENWSRNYATFPPEIHPYVDSAEVSYLINECCQGCATLAVTQESDGAPVLTVCWFDPTNNHSLTVRRLSIDHVGDPISYAGYP